MKLEFHKISKSANRKSFDCGIESLNEYLRKYALQNTKKNIAVTIVAVPEDDETKILGYYTVSMAQIKFNSLIPELRKGLPRYPVSAMRIGKLAVDRSAQGKGLGRAILRDALLRALNLSSEIGIHVVTVDAIDEKAKKFYEHFDFIPLIDRPLTLILALKTIANAYGYR